jgi:transporter family protein
VAVAAAAFSLVSAAPLIEPSSSLCLADRDAGGEHHAAADKRLDFRRAGIDVSWFVYALISATAAAVTAILAKVGIEGVPSTLATALRCVVVTAFAWAMAIGLQEQRALPTLSRRSLIFLGLSGLATGISWLAYFRALQLAPASSVAPIDKLSLPLTILIAAIFLREPLRWQLVAGVALIVAGALLTTRV